MIYIIGCGGVGSWLTEAMARLVDKDNLTLVDGDTLEEKNLDRQLFTAEQIGENKAVALAGRMGIKSVLDRWYSQYEVEHNRSDWLLCCVDNNPGRLACLAASDMYDCVSIFAANEVHSSEAYVYRPEWKDTPLDPRSYIPELVSDTTGNPLARGSGCTGEAQAQNRQLVTANFMAAALAAHMFVVWAMEGPKTKPESRAYLPYRLNQNLTRNSYVLRGELATRKENATCQ